MLGANARKGEVSHGAALPSEYAGQPAHAVRNKTEAPYARSDLFERRRLPMEQWAAYLCP